MATDSSEQRARKKWGPEDSATVRRLPRTPPRSPKSLRPIVRAQGSQRTRTRGREGTRIAIPHGAGDPETRRTGGGGALTGGGAGAGPERLQSPQTKNPRPAHRSRPRVPPTRGPGLCVRALRRTPPSQVSEPSALRHPPSPSTPLALQPQFPRVALSIPCLPTWKLHLRTSWFPARLCPLQPRPTAPATP